MTGTHPLRGRPDDPYEVLAVSRQATRPELTRAYHRLARVLHPDVAGRGGPGAEQFARIAEAYRVLSDPALRAAYDAKTTRRTAADDDGPQHERGRPVGPVRGVANLQRQGRSSQSPITAGPVYVERPAGPRGGPIDE